MSRARSVRASAARPPIKLAPDAPLSRLTPQAAKRLDAEDLQRSEEQGACAASLTQTSSCPCSPRACAPGASRRLVGLMRQR